MEGETQEEPVKDLNELQNADWVRRSTWISIITLRQECQTHCTSWATCSLLWSWVGQTSERHCKCISASLTVPLVFQSGAVLGTGDERSKTWCKVEEGPGAPVQPTTHRVPAHTLRDVDGRHPFKTLQAAKSHGEGVWRFFVFVLCVVQRQAMVLFCSVTFHF